MGGVAGQNDGTLDRCTYSGTMGDDADTDGLVSVGARSTGSTVAVWVSIDTNWVNPILMASNSPLRNFSHTMREI